MERPIRILAVSGSLRARSSNTEVLRAAAMLASSPVTFEFYSSLGELPHFNPDLDGIGSVVSPTVATLRAAVDAADAVIISSPEYAHGVPGSLKNALDWLVSGHEIVGKPVGLLTASRHSVHGPASLVETLRTMSARVVDDACIVVPLDGRRLNADAIAGDDALAQILRAALGALESVVRGAQ